MRTAFLVFITCLSLCTITFAQEQPPQQTSQEQSPQQPQQQIVPEEPGVTEVAVKNEMNAHHFRFGIFRLQPRFVFGSGYDSNALYRENEVIGDYFFSAVPGIRIGLKLGQHAFFDLGEALEFLYYKNLSERRDIFNTTDALFLTGTDRLLLTLDGNYVRRKAPFNEEIDVPVDHRILGGGFLIKYLLTNKVTLSPSMRVQQVEFLASDNSFELENRRLVSAGLAGNYNFRPEFSVAAGFNQGHVVSLTTNTTTNFYGAFTGIDSTANRFNGYFHIGIGKATINQQDIHPLLFDATANFLIGRHLKISVFGEKKFEASAFTEASIRITSRVGTRISLPLSRRFTVYPSYVYGSNNYGTTEINGDQVNIDRYQTAEFDLGFHLIDRLQLRGGIEYLKRNSSIQGLSKNRVAYLIGLSYSLD